MQGSILSVYVIDARDLKPFSGVGAATPQVRLQIEGQSAKTQQISGTNEPVWDEVIIFDIRRGEEPLKVILYDVARNGTRNPIGYAKVDLLTLS
jgi:Ca2+-dependent lipid-binding protein